MCDIIDVIAIILLNFLHVKLGIVIVAQAPWTFNVTSVHKKYCYWIHFWSVWLVYRRHITL